MDRTQTMNPPVFPEDRRFAFTVFDDTDNSTLQNTRPVYDLLESLGMRTTKSVWVERPRGPSSGACLRDDDYRSWILELRDAGFEIGFHGVGDGDFSRDEILAGIAAFREIVGHGPRVYANHQSNPYNVYWWSRRFPWPFDWLYSIANALRRRSLGGEGGHVEGSGHFWGDALKQEVEYIRNLTFNSVDTFACDPHMPYRRRDTPYANFWFSSSDGHTVEEFNDLVSTENVDRLEREGGVCIVYTHFASGFVDADGTLHPEFRRRMEALAKRDGWFVPTGRLLDHLRSRRSMDDEYTTSGYQRRLAIRWAMERVLKRIRYGR